MKKTLISLSILTSLTVGFSTSALASDSACTAILCLAGALTGDKDSASSSDCKKPQREFFSKLSFKHGHFDKKGTKNKRRDFLKGCTRDDLAGWDSQIIDKFGGQRYGF